MGTAPDDVAAAGPITAAGAFVENAEGRPSAATISIEARGGATPVVTGREATPRSTAPGTAGTRDASAGADPGTFADARTSATVGPAEGITQAVAAVIEDPFTAEEGRTGRTARASLPDEAPRFNETRTGAFLV